MKTKLIIIPALLLLAAACQRMEQETPVTKESENNIRTLTVQAVKGSDETKSLILVNGVELDAYWKEDEEVKVYKEGTLLGTLKANLAQSAGLNPTSATLSGDIDVTGLNENDELTLMLPRENWDYTGQKGILTGTGSIEDTYDYAVATVKVDAIDGDKVTTTTTANFANQQSIYRLVFKLSDDSTVNVKDFTLTATNDKLVQSFSYTNSAWTPTYGSLSVSLDNASTEPIFVSIRNESTAEDTYHFVITGASGDLYLANKVIPSGALDAYGKFISATTIATKQPEFNPAATSGNTVDDPAIII
ncbi:MAG: hypothetical protein J5669_07585 [Bacteroidales bacterium]|nr:hypothetical protein [Bacteroidales bacterium]